MLLRLEAWLHVGATRSESARVSVAYARSLREGRGLNEELENVSERQIGYDNVIRTWQDAALR